MLKLMNAFWPLLRSRRLQIALTAGLLTVVATGVASAQTDGVVFVDDLEQQVMQAARRGQSTPASRTVRPSAIDSRLPSPSPPSRFQQATAQSMSASLSKEREQSSWTSGLKKSLGGWFGGSDDTKGAVAVDKSTRSSNPLKRSYASSRRESKSSDPRQLQPPISRAQVASPSSAKTSPLPAVRSGGIEERATTAGNQPRGLFQLWGSKSVDEQLTKRSAQRTGTAHVASTATPQSTTPARRAAETPQSWASKLISPLAASEQAGRPQAFPKAPAWQGDEMVAMVSDREPAEPIASQKSDVRLASNAARASDGPLPQVFGPVATSDWPDSALASRVPQALPAPVVLAPEVGGTASATASREPQEIVNQHAMANANRRPSNQAQPSWQPPAASAPVATTPSQVVSRVRSQQQGVNMPANPVALPDAKDQKPIEKSVQLLTEANRLSTTAATEAEFTTVIQLCRHVLAIDDAPAAVKYSHDLASWALNRRGELKSDEGRTKEALLDFQDALRLDPNRWRAIHNRGVLAAQAGRFADAFDDFNRTIDLNPKFAKAYSNRAALYVQAGKLPQASEDYRQAIALDPDLAVAHKGRGTVCHMLGQFDMALQHFDAATLLAPNDARIVNNRGDLLTDMGRYRAALGDYERAIELDSSLAVAYRNLAWLQATCPDKDCRDANKAVTNADRALQLSSEPGDLEYDTLAAAHASAGDFAAAKSMIDKAIELAADADKPNYKWRKTLYERNEPYITEPASNIQQASYIN